MPVQHTRPTSQMRMPGAPKCPRGGTAVVRSGSPTIAPQCAGTGACVFQCDGAGPDNGGYGGWHTCPSLPRRDASASCTSTKAFRPALEPLCGRFTLCLGGCGLHSTCGWAQQTRQTVNHAMFICKLVFQLGAGEAGATQHEACISQLLVNGIRVWPVLIFRYNTFAPEAVNSLPQFSYTWLKLCSTRCKLNRHILRCDYV